MYYVFAAVILLVSYICTLIVQRFLPLPHEMRNLKKIALIIAHPDDEVMFFTPTILQLVNLVHPERFYIICITKGDHDGSPTVREKELIASCRSLGVNRDNIVFLNDSRFLDHPSRRWNVEELSLKLASVLEIHGIESVLTFDSGGVSGHINHKDTHKAVMMIRTHRKFILADVNLFRKYSSLIDVVYTFVVDGVVFQRPVFVSGPVDVHAALKAMQYHSSQFVWFRKLYFMFSRYVVVNHLKIVEPLEK